MRDQNQEQLVREAGVRLQAREFRSAYDLALLALQQDERCAEAYFVLATIAAEHENFVKAEELARRAIGLDPRAAKYLALLAQALMRQRKESEALSTANRAAELVGKDAHALDTIGVVYSHAGFYERAISFFERAIALDSANPSFLRNLGVAAQFAGDFDAAERAYREELKYAAKQRRPYAALVQLRKQSPEENFLPELEAQFAQETDIKARLQIGHAIAKTLEDLGQWPESLAWLQRAKEPMAKAVGDITGRAAALFTAAREAFARTPLGGGDPSAAPIFIVGMPRTGTTLTDRILTSLPGVASAGELGFIQRLASEMAMPLAEQPLSDARVMAASARLDVSVLGRNYLELARERLPADCAHFVDKMPINFLYAGLIHRALPNARIICLRRDPMDACLSNFRQIFSPDAAHYWYSFRLDWTAAYYAAFDAMIAHWREVLPSDRFTEVRYESMVADLEPEARRLVEFCGLPWDARCLDFHENSQPVATASSVQSRAPLYNTSVGRWRRYGEGIKPLEQALAARGF